MNKKILIVEDNPQNMRLFEMVLRAENYTLLKATDGEEALDMATRERPDLIIMDVQLPKLNGLEVTRKLRDTLEFSHIPIIAITAFAMKGDKERAIEAGCDAYLSKPIDTRQLPGMIAEMLLQQQKTLSSTNGDGNGKQDPCNR
ncbi:MAG: response regulator [Dehalococcoidales bacterium]|nr:response regulator [Dehalococcoidales bacterium]